MSGFILGQRVRFAEHLKRKTKVGEGYYADVTKVWTGELYPGKRTDGGEGIIIGRRVLSNGKNNYPGYDEPIEYKGTEFFPVYLIVTDLRRKPVHVLPEHITALDEAPTIEQEIMRHEVVVGPYFNLVCKCGHVGKTVSSKGDFERHLAEALSTKSGTTHQGAAQ